MGFNVIIRRAAQADLEANLAWWSRHGQVEAIRWREKFLTSVIAKLEVDPHSYPEADEAAELGFNLRMMLYGRGRQVYRILFTIDGNVVRVHRVRHAAQQSLTPEDF